MNMKLRMVAICVVLCIIGVSTMVDASFGGSQKAALSARLMSQLEAAADEYRSSLGASFCEGGAMGDEGCALLSTCDCNSPLVCDTNAGTCASAYGIQLCTGSCRAPVWIWVIAVLIPLSICCCCYAVFRRRRATQAVIMINGPAAQQSNYAPPPAVYASPVGQPQYAPQQQMYAQPPQPYGHPQQQQYPPQYGQQTAQYQRLPGQN